MDDVAPSICEGSKIVLHVVSDSLQPVQSGPPFAKALETGEIRDIRRRCSELDIF